MNKQPDLNEIHNKVIGWAWSKGLLVPENSFKQTVKLGEEFGELCAGVVKNKPDVIKDSIGDCMVVLSILAAQNNLTLPECFEAAWEEIKDRKGVTRDGVFIKDSDADIILV